MAFWNPDLEEIAAHPGDGLAHAILESVLALAERA